MKKIASDNGAVKETTKKSKFGNLPGAGPGRPKGSKNKYTAFISDLFEVWEEANGRERLKEFIEKNDRNFGKCLEVMAKLMPKEIKLSGELDSEVTVKKAYEGMTYDQLNREFDQKIRATRCLLVGSDAGTN